MGLPTQLRADRADPRPWTAPQASNVHMFVSGRQGRSRTGWWPDDRFWVR
jgi:hypothetical protein